MSETEIKLVVYRFYEEMLNLGQLERASEFVAGDFIDHNSYYPGMPSGIEGFKQLFALSFASFPDLHFSIEALYVDGDIVTSREVMTGSHLGDFMGHAPTGKSFKVNAINIMRVVDGKIKERWGVFEELGMLSQLGLIDLG